jgi:hypothetical protein
MSDSKTPQRKAQEHKKNDYTVKHRNTNGIAVIATPLADESLSKKCLKLVKKAAKAKVSVCECVCVCMCMSVSWCMYVCVLIRRDVDLHCSLHILTYTHIYTHIHTHTPGDPSRHQGSNQGSPKGGSRCDGACW